MVHLKFILLITFIFIPAFIFATTWDEPWQDQVIRQADYFVFAKLNSFDNKNIKIEIIKSLGGRELKGSINISNFYLLTICSLSSGEGPDFHFSNIKECYFFLKTNDKGEYCIATPTSGFAPLIDGNVIATYRHSYNKAVVPVSIYEKTMIAIFNNYHNLDYDKLFISNFVTKYLSLKPSDFKGGDKETFFAQHVALECIYHLRLKGFYSKCTPFLNDSSNFQNQISGARAMISYNTPECKKELLKSINDQSKGTFVQVICVWSLTEFKPKELKNELTKLEKNASTEQNDFGGNIMDPRVCTYIPSVKDALDKLISAL